MFGFTAEPRPFRRWCHGASPSKGLRPRRPERFADGGVEPTVEELLNDPVMGVIMSYDHVTPTALRSLIDVVRSRLQHRMA